jgi:hypothetical protein
MKMQEAHPIGVLVYGTPDKLATAVTVFMTHIGSDVMGMLSMPAGDQKQRPERRSYVTSC